MRRTTGFRRRRAFLGSLVVALTFYPTLTSWADHIPAAPAPAFRVGGQATAIAKTDVVTAILAAGSSGRRGEVVESAASVGGYYRIHRNVKAGAFYRARLGVRHDDDWVNVHREDGSHGWEWADTSGRLEHVLVLDVSPRFLLPFLPGETWVLMVKARWELSSYQGEQVLWIRPSITFFHLVDRRPVLNAGVGYGVDFSLNFGDTGVYSQALYGNLLYHATRALKIEVSAERRRTTWSTSRDVRATSGDTYQIDERRIDVSLGLIYLIAL